MRHSIILHLCCQFCCFYYRALKSTCNNAKHPDLYGHYREAAFTQTKHHWWWKANRVFDQLEVTRYHTGKLLLLIKIINIYNVKLI